MGLSKQEFINKLPYTLIEFLIENGAYEKYTSQVNEYFEGYPFYKSDLIAIAFDWQYSWEGSAYWKDLDKRWARRLQDLTTTREANLYKSNKALI